MATSREHVLHAAATLLSRRPTASMAEVAEAAGISRATLHRLVPGRDQLVRELAGHALEAAIKAVADAEPERGEAVDAAHRVVVALAPIADLYAFLSGENQLDEAGPELDARWEELDERIVRLFRRGQESGAFRVDLSAEWMSECLSALLVGAGYAVRMGRLASGDVVRVVTTCLVDGVRRRS
ncbi:TetR/AcrR family transcriptional regulator [Pseudonocardia acaciae]|uniref:TetR/AcrR family transcriptional regulator n=1 Tax=Pseudonocardia acaciae TaxID=551276 RepID=UPI0004910B49|nr:TetR/AcrR family transcriptional regulator [Pseudonocardia acaciae]